MAEFLDRQDAGRRLAALLTDFNDEPAVVVLGLPRGGVPVAEQVARSLQRPLDVIVVRKLGLPVHPELAMGAIGEDGVLVRNEDVIRHGQVSDRDLERVASAERAELERRVRAWRGDRGRLDLTGRVALLVDDGIATGATTRAAVQVARSLGAVEVVVAAPVAPADLSAADLDADELVVVEAPPYFRAVGLHYARFDQTPDDEVAAILRAARPSSDD